LVQHEHLAIWRPTGRSGLSAVIGSWKIMAMPLPRRRRISPADASDLLPVEHDLPPLSDKRRRNRPMMAKRRDALAAARFAHQAEASPRPISNDTFSTAP